jgi:hypothetical protein
MADLEAELSPLFLNVASMNLSINVEGGSIRYEMKQNVCVCMPVNLNRIFSLSTSSPYNF